MPITRDITFSQRAQVQPLSMFSSIKRGFSFDERQGVRISKESISRPVPAERDWAASLPDSSYLQRPPASIKVVRPQHARNHSEPAPILKPVHLPPPRRAFSLRVVIGKNMNKPLPPTPIEGRSTKNADARTHFKPTIDIPEPVESELAVKAATESLQEIMGGMEAILPHSPSEYSDDDMDPRNCRDTVVSPISPHEIGPSAWKARMDSMQQETFIKRLSNRLSGLNFQFEIVKSPTATEFEIEIQGNTSKEEPDVPVDVDIVLKVLREDDEIGMDVTFDRDSMQYNNTTNHPGRFTTERRLTVGSRNSGPALNEERDVLEARRMAMTFTDSPTDDIIIDDGIFGEMDQ